jgi:hypothetical protein
MTSLSPQEFKPKAPTRQTQAGAGRFRAWMHTSERAQTISTPENPAASPGECRVKTPDAKSIVLPELN